MTSATSAAAERRSGRAFSVVMTMVRASAGASVNRLVDRSRSSEPVMTAMGGVAVRPARRAGTMAEGWAGR
jgi:hypothetical protein